MHPSDRERDACGTGFVADAAGGASRDVVERGLEALCRVRHRGATDADAKTGDGAGVLLQIPRMLLAAELARLRVPHLDPDRLGVAMLFHRDALADRDLRQAADRAFRSEGMEVVAWREVPVDASALGLRASDTRPRIAQALFVGPRDRSVERAERACHRARRRLESSARELAPGSLYVASCSFLTVTYKALVAADELAHFYPDLSDPRTASSFALFHQRYSTNTTPTWERAQPFRMLCHNGEINTISGNVHRMRGREGRLGTASILDEELLKPAIDEGGSDSAMLDNAVELLTREGADPDDPRDIRQVMAMLVPAAWEGLPDLDEDVRGFYRWHAAIMEPWDGPAALVFTDGVRVGACLDRNGLRPMRWYATEDGLVACSSEAGSVPLGGRGRVRRGKLGPGQMLVVDPAADGLQLDPVRRMASRRAYGDWADKELSAQSAGDPLAAPLDELGRLQSLHGYTREELSLVLRPAAGDGKEPTYSMGDDTAIAPFSSWKRPLYNHCKQRFAQVTNPPIDHLRERHVFSIRTVLGPRDPVLWERPEAASMFEYPTFLLFRPPGGFHLDATWPVSEGVAGLRAAVERLAAAAVRAATLGSGIQIVSDEEASPLRAPVPALLAVGAVNTALVRAGHRTRTSIVVQTDDARESHHVACLLAFGAEAVFPRLALATVAAQAKSTPEEALLQWRTSVEEGVLKVMAKLGISCVDSYRGAQTFDAVGLAHDVMRTCFPGSESPLGGMTFEDIAADVLERHAAAFPDAQTLASPGFVKFHKGGEYHETNPDVVRSLHRTVDPSLSSLKSTAAGDGDAADLDAASEIDESPPASDDAMVAAAHALQRAVSEPGDPERYARFAALVDSRLPAEPRDLLEFVPAGDAVSLDEVEPVAAILRRFSTGAISHGAISAEAHETLALALNMIGGRSNTGEGGEDPSRYRTAKNSKIKQVASGRFGVTPEYCSFAEELQIKMAQGSKPGEGGQLPGHKVTDEIARLRHTQPGVALISPAPHHDIYSIEDLSQLIYDLKQVNPAADVSVKLVAEVGVGTIAAGVAKGLAEVVHISGSDGGTGASPLSSIKNAGLPWEIGLADTQQALVESGLRGRVRVRVDGGFKTGRDVVAAALLGADEFSFGTAALLAEGCIMVRSCHLDTCPVGIATQKPELRTKFAGTPEMVAAYLTAVAEDVRVRLASLGLRSIDEAVGRTDLLRQRTVGTRAGTVDLGVLLAPPGDERSFTGTLALQRIHSALGDRVHEEVWPALRDGWSVRLAFDIGNGDRTVGARLGGAIGHEFGEGAPPGSASVAFRGHAGQSFGAFLGAGVEFFLVGEANDYVGKGMGGGRIVITPPSDDAGDPWLAGNTVLYGATGGELFVNGRVGERFAIRNSGALAVAEGAGEHACEYMTGGTVVILGPVGMNVGAGMTGGRAFIWDPDWSLDRHLNDELVEHRSLEDDEVNELHALLTRHAALTGSPRALAMLDDWDRAPREFRLVLPRPEVAAITRKNEGTRAAKGS
ncbi:MAG TPA: glutamate synthase-related protein [Actinomycetota bacterium]|nr:glutamate synthase-related protein [Actinomycetota bacterium]